MTDAAVAEKKISHTF